MSLIAISADTRPACYAIRSLTDVLSVVPGLILFTVLGIGPLIVPGGLWRRQPWAWYGTVAVGSALLIWIAVEIWMIGYHPEPPLQLIYGTLGLVLLILTFRDSVRRAILDD